MENSLFVQIKYQSSLILGFHISSPSKYFPTKYLPTKSLHLPKDSVPSWKKMINDYGKKMKGLCLKHYPRRARRMLFFIQHITEDYV